MTDNTQPKLSEPDDKQDLAFTLTAYLEEQDVVVIPALFASEPNVLCFILPASEGSLKKVAGILSRSKICDYRDVGYVDAMSTNSKPILEALSRTFPEGYTIVALEIKDIKVRNIPIARTDD